MSNSPRTDAYMINNRFPSVFELATMASELEAKVSFLEKEVEYLKHQLSVKESIINDLEEQLYDYNTNEKLSA
jgi:hypothetical protein